MFIWPAKAMKISTTSLIIISYLCFFTGLELHKPVEEPVCISFIIFCIFDIFLLQAGVGLYDMVIMSRVFSSIIRSK